MAKTYLGSLCKRGHDHEDTGMSLRYMRGWVCVECAKEESATRRIKEKEKIRTYQKKYRIDNKKKLAQQKRVYYLKNKERLNKKNKEYRVKNKKK